MWLLALAALAIASEESAGMDNALNAGGGGGYSMSNPGGPDPSSGEGGPEFNQSDPASKALKAKLKQAKASAVAAAAKAKVDAARIIKLEADLKKATVAKAQDSQRAKTMQRVSRSSRRIWKRPRAPTRPSSRH